MKYNAQDRFYGVFNDSTQDSDEAKYFSGALYRLNEMLKEGEIGSIATAQYLDHDTYEYEVLYFRYYLKTSGKLKRINDVDWEARRKA